MTDAPLPPETCEAAREANCLRALEARLAQAEGRAEAAERRAERLEEAALRAETAEAAKARRLVRQEVARAEAATEARLRAHLSYKFGAEIVALETAPLRAVWLPLSLWRVWRRHAAEASARGGRPRRRGRLRAEVLEEKLWRGFSEPALEDLAALAEEPEAAPAEAAHAAWALARWRFVHGGFAEAARLADAMAAADPERVGDKRRVLLEAEALSRSGRSGAARAAIERALEARPADPDLRLAMANALAFREGDPAAPPDPALDRERLGWINRVLLEAGFRALALRDPAAPLSLDNLTAEAGSGIDSGPTVSVIMPVFRAEATLPAALRNLRAQSWRALEILVVDDRSPDATAAVAEAVTAEDPRVRVLRLAENGGSYVARNAGLRAATGDYVTTHDADDWSHPQKIETQMRLALERPDVAAVMSDWVRCSSAMRFGWLDRPWSGLIGKNMSSILLRRDRFEALGGWDPVRVGGDTEILRRVERLWGAEAVHIASPGVPLAFGRHEAGSLTRRSTTHVRTRLHGPRRDYEAAAAYWRESVADRAALRLSHDPARRPFPAPVSVLRGSRDAGAADLLFVSDFRLRGGAFVSTLNYMEAAVAEGRSVVAFHWPRYDLVGVTDWRSLNPALHAMVQEGRARLLSAGERLRAETVIVGYPVVLEHPVDLAPEIETDRAVIVVNQMAARLRDGRDPQYDPRRVRRTARAAFGVEPLWAPISGLVRRLMAEDPRYPAPIAEDWTPLIETGSWTETPILWRGRARARPVIGRHARDHYTKWPSDPQALAAAYGVGRPCEVAIMGGAKRAVEVLGAQPENWTVTSFGALDSMDFLQGLDVFVHYPHEDYVEEFGRAVLEALAAGRPAVLPSVFEQTFGEAALYAEPAEAWEAIERLWRDEAAWLAQARRGRNFVRRQSDWSRFAERLARLPPPAPRRPRTSGAGEGPEPLPEE